MFCFEIILTIWKDGHHFFSPRGIMAYIWSNKSIPPFLLYLKFMQCSFLKYTTRIELSDSCSGFRIRKKNPKTFKFHNYALLDQKSSESLYIFIHKHGWITNCRIYRLTMQSMPQISNTTGLAIRPMIKSPQILS